LDFEDLKRQMLQQETQKQSKRKGRPGGSPLLEAQRQFPGAKSPDGSPLGELRKLPAKQRSPKARKQRHQSLLQHSALAIGHFQTNGFGSKSSNIEQKKEVASPPNPVLRRVSHRIMKSPATRGEKIKRHSTAMTGHKKKVQLLAKTLSVISDESFDTQSNSTVKKGLAHSLNSFDSKLEYCPVKGPRLRTHAERNSVVMGDVSAAMAKKAAAAAKQRSRLVRRRSTSSLSKNTPAKEMDLSEWRKLAQKPAIVEGAEQVDLEASLETEEEQRRHFEEGLVDRFLQYIKMPPNLRQSFDHAEMVPSFQPSMSFLPSVRPSTLFNPSISFRPFVRPSYYVCPSFFPSLFPFVPFRMSFDVLPSFLSCPSSSFDRIDYVWNWLQQKESSQAS
jgi:hypothetical protein